MGTITNEQDALSRLRGGDEGGGVAGQTPRGVAAVPAPRRRWLSRIALPVAILVLAAGLLAFAARQSLWPATPVHVVRVVAKEAAAAPGSDPGDATVHTEPTVTVQAPGWVEPDPYPIYVSALTDGVIDQVLVLEGEPVEAGQVVAIMVDDDAKLSLARARAELARRQADLTAARTDWDYPIALERAVAVNDAMLAESRAELDQLEATIAQEQAKLKEIQINHDRLARLLPNAAAELEVERIQYQLQAQQALLQATRKQRAVLEAKAARYEAEVKAAKEDLRLRVSQRQALDEATAAVDEAQAMVDEASLRLRRMAVTSAAAGIVMNRLAAPGAKLMLAMDAPHSAHVVHLYDPKRLQVRVDVPLADAAKVGVGQQAIVVVDVLPDRKFSGRITRFVHQADIGKNTVEVKVAIEDPSPILKPDMLARVQFLSTGGDGGDDGDGATRSASSLRMFVPDAVVQRDGDGASVWLVTPGDSTAQRRPVKLGGRRSDGWVEVRQGLNPGDVIIADAPADLREGGRVKVIEQQ